MEEKILLSIEIQKPEGEKEVDALTRKITDLQIATANLQKQNNELIKAGKQNSQEYVENTRQIELNKQKITEATATRKGLIQTLVAEENSIKALRVRNAELIKQRDLLNTSTEAGRIKIAQINAELDKNNDVIKANVSAQEKQRLGVGGYVEALDKLVPGLGATINGIKDVTKAALAFVASPFGIFLGVIGGLIFAFTKYIQGSEEGQNRWNKVVQVGSAILEQFMNIVEGVGEVIFDAFENPKQAAIDLIKFLESQFVNRITGMITLIPRLASAVEQLFKGNFAEAGKIAGDAVGQVVLGIENATDKISNFIDETNQLIQQGIENGERIAALNAQIDRDERRLIVDRQRLNLEVQKLREDALQKEGEERKKIILEAIALEQQLANQETAIAKNRLALAQATLEANGDDKEALKEVAQARADVFAAEATAFQNTLRFRKEIAAIDEQIKRQREKDAADAIELARRTAAEIAEAEKQQFENNLAFLEESNLEKLNKIKEDYLNQVIAKEEFDKQVTDLEIQALETRKAFFLANLMDTSAIEAEILDKQIKQKEANAAKEAKIEKAKLDNEKAITAARIGLFASLGQVLQQIAGKNKALAIAGVIIQKAAAIAQIIAQTAIANAQAIATFWITGGLPWTAINTAQAVLSIGSVVAEAATSIAQINSSKRGGIIRAARGKLLGGILRGPSHERGGIPFTVRGMPGFEAEGGEVIINKKSSKMFRNQLSAINSFNGWGDTFKRGGMTYQSGSIISANQTRQASVQADNRTAIQESLSTMMQSLPPIIVTVEDINERATEVSNQTQKVSVI
jgi:hypothetical protein